MRLRYDVEALEKNPYVYSVSSNKMRLRVEFRILLFNEWKRSNNVEIIKQMMEDHGITEDKVYKKYYQDVVNNFKMGGFPVPSNVTEYQDNPDLAWHNPLVSSGLYIRRQGDGKLDISDDFWYMLFSGYPDVSIEDGMVKAGLSLLDIGYARVYRLKPLFNYYKEHPEECKRMKQVSPVLMEQDEKAEADTITVEIIDHPYIVYHDQTEPSLVDGFFNEAHLLAPLGIEKIFDIYSIQQKWFTASDRITTISKLLHWSPTSVALDDDSEIFMAIQRRRLAATVKLLNINFQAMKDAYSKMNIPGKRKLFRMLQNLPRDPWGFYTSKRILSQMGIPRSTYYEILSNEFYGVSLINKLKQDEDDIEIIRRVLGYKGFEKGIRQVYMLLPRLTDKQFSIHKIRRLMNKYGIRTTIRRPSKNRKAMKELIERNKKANLLMRKFKLHRPNEVRLTDVTYLDYGDHKRAYGSASIDPVTGRLICFIVSEHNDLKLAMDTLAAMDSYPAKSGAILHSDQGILYMTDDFQMTVIEKGLTQSMSRRGNCWDNAPQESFFGHFKDESHYSECLTVEELQRKIDEYSVYYNNERGMWEKSRMTPIEYETYLHSMSEDEYHIYLDEKEKRFLEMKEKAVQKAVKDAKDYNDFTKAQLGDMKQ